VINTVRIELSDRIGYSTLSFSSIVDFFLDFFFVGFGTVCFLLVCLSFEILRYSAALLLASLLTDCQSIFLSWGDCSWETFWGDVSPSLTIEVLSFSVIFLLQVVTSVLASLAFFLSSSWTYTQIVIFLEFVWNKTFRRYFESKGKSVSDPEIW